MCEQTSLPDLHHPAHYNNRELSWLAFNERVLQEALDSNNPLLERLKFLGIFSSNLDEFFMVRVAGLKDQVKAGFNKPENKAGLTPKQQLSAITKKNRSLVGLQDNYYTDVLLPLLAKEGIKFLTIRELNDEQMQYLTYYFKEYVFPVLTPMAIDAYHPFPMLLNKSINLAVLLHKGGSTEQRSLAIVQVPSVLNRVVELPAANHQKHFIMLEQVISEFINDLFQGYEVMSVSPFRITRNADLSIHEEGARDLLSEIEKELKKRKWGAAVRLEYQQGLMDSQLLRYLTTELEVHEKDVYYFKGALDLTFLTSLRNHLASEYEHLVDETIIPQPPQDLTDEDDIFSAVSKKDVLLHHPYESFYPVIEFVNKAAEDKDVLAIKQTLYRVSGDSPIIKALEKAAGNGKQVTVLVELKARFDEENNIQWAKKLEKAGVHVIYGITGLKTHSKITLIVKKQHGKIKRFVHLGTGNYNDSTAKLYTDMGYMTCKQEFGEDATNFFNYLSGYREKPDWNQICASPGEIRECLLQHIDDEIACHKDRGGGKIIAKMNSLTDKPLILKLYEASIAGVSIDLIVRGICCLRPGIEGISDNIRVISIVGQYLEHTRIFYFHHHGQEKLFLSSADWMTRNMDKRIEIMFPILERSLKDRLCDTLQMILSDNVKARIQDKHGNYEYVQRNPKELPLNSQMTFVELASKWKTHHDE
ncbi:polyphosphate kinase [Alteribacillus persepolensis]|uniref:Polyphosphate kinase n=1 Tax=Alteribacillus persepolensis TaxID=568899 RepID=A0A1G8CU03_9BACI|nr:RNA degradosome polyphosphate kinase [Alteribacillus persepolensis]SDH48743.1 polyphosphate kinase [Alteribacillus persepolensis]